MASARRRLDTTTNSDGKRPLVPVSHLLIDLDFAMFQRFLTPAGLLPYSQRPSETLAVEQSDRQLPMTTAPQAEY